MTMKRLVLLMAIAALVFWAAGCRPAADGLPGDALSAEAARGAALYASRCRRCHKVDGAGGSRGPDLSRIGSKRDGDWLARFLTNPQSVDADNKMPQVFLRPEELSAVVKYLQTLD